MGYFVNFFLFLLVWKKNKTIKLKSRKIWIFFPHCTKKKKIWLLYYLPSKDGSHNNDNFNTVMMPDIIVVVVVYIIFVHWFICNHDITRSSTMHDRYMYMHRMKNHREHPAVFQLFAYFFYFFSNYRYDNLITERSLLIILPIYKIKIDHYYVHK